MTVHKRMLLLGTALAAATACAASADVVFRATPQVVTQPTSSGDAGSGGQAGNPTSPASLTASPGSIADFVVTAPGSSPATRTVRIANGGGSASVVPIPTTTGPFAVVSDGCGAPLAAGASCDIAIAPYATSDGAFSGSLAVAGVETPVELSGTASGFAPVVSASPTASQTSNVVGGVTPAASPAVFTVRNTGGSPSGAILPILTSGGADFVLGGTCGSTVASLPADGTSSCTVTVARTAANNDPTGRTAELVISFANGGTSAHVVTGTAAGFAASLSHAVGTLTVGGITTAASTGACTDLKISNNGNLAGGGGATVAFTGGGAASFQTCTTANQRCTASAIPAGSFCNIGVQLKSSAINATYTATATVTGSGLSAGGRTVTGTVSGLTPAISPAGTGTIAVAAVTDGSSSGSCTTVAVTNSGTTAGLANLMVAISGTNPSNFGTCVPTGTACSSTPLAVGASCNVGLQVLSTTAGSFSATASFSASGAGTVQRTISSSTSGYVATCSTSVAAGTACKADGFDLVHMGSGLYFARCDAGQTLASWGCSGTRATPTWNAGTMRTTRIAIPATSQTDGMANTTALAASTSADAPYAAAKTCRNLGAKWFLPAKTQLTQLHTLRTTGDVAGTMSTPGGVYWSSTEVGGNPAAAYVTMEHQGATNVFNDNLQVPHYVRCAYQP